MRSVPVPSSRVNCNSFLDLGTATHSFTLTALKSDLLFGVKNPLLSPAVWAPSALPSAFLEALLSKLFIVGIGLVSSYVLFRLCPLGSVQMHFRVFEDCRPVPC